MPTVSIAMATYNGARFLRAQLDSLASQTLRPLELVVTDDGSTDDTLSIVADFVRTAPFPVHVRRNAARLGYKANFIHCASLCAGDLIAFCDQDDIWFEHKLATQAAAFDDPHVLMSSHDATLIDAEGQSLGRTYHHPHPSTTMTFWNAAPFAFSMGFTLVFSRRLLVLDRFWRRSIDSNAPDEPMAHDQWFSFAALIFGSMVHRREALAHYRQHDRNASGLRKAQTRLGRALQVLADRVPEYERLTRATLNRAELLRGFATDWDDALQSLGDDALPRVQRAAHDYSVLHAATRRRRDLYRSASIPHRCAVFMQSLRSGDYRRGSLWHFTPNGALRDFLALPLPLQNLQP